MVDNPIQEPYLIIEDGAGKTLLGIFSEKRITCVASICGGNGQCGKCRVKVTGELKATNKPTRIERRFVSGEEFSEGIRLAVKLRFKEK